MNWPQRKQREPAWLGTPNRLGQAQWSSRVPRFAHQKWSYQRISWQVCGFSTCISAPQTVTCHQIAWRFNAQMETVTLSLEWAWELVALTSRCCLCTDPSESWGVTSCTGPWACGLTSPGSLWEVSVLGPAQTRPTRNPSGPSGSCGGLRAPLVVPY